MPARPVPTVKQIEAALDRASAGQARQLIRLLRTMPEADLLAGFACFGMHVRAALHHAAARMECRAEFRKRIRAARKAEKPAARP